MPIMPKRSLVLCAANVLLFAARPICMPKPPRDCRGCYGCTGWCIISCGFILPPEKFPLSPWASSRGGCRCRKCSRFKWHKRMISNGKTVPIQLNQGPGKPIEHNLPWRDADNFFDAFDNTHGRRVRRRVWTMMDVASLPALEKWPGLQTVIAVETIRMAHKQALVTSDYRFYLSSLRRSADALVTMIRQHWDIEHKLHWSLDVTFNEDRCRIRKDHAAENMVAFRHMSLNLLRQE